MVRRLDGVNHRRRLLPIIRSETLVGKQVLAVVNFPPRQIGPFMSEVLTLGLPDADGEVVLVVPDKPVPDGVKLY